MAGEAFKTEEYKRIRKMFGMTASGDPWGETMSWIFPICEEIYWRRRDEIDVPPEWMFKPSPLGPVVEKDDFYADEVATYNSETLLTFGNVLYRYSRYLKRDGKDY